MCNPLAALPPLAQFGISAATSIGGYMAQRQATNARNRARLLNFREANKQYHANVIINNVRWKNGQLDTEIAYDNLFQQAADSWRQQDQVIEQARSQHVENTIIALTELARKEYAGTQTGVTASRLANEGTRKVGFALTKSARQLMMAKDKAKLNKEIVTADANRRRRKIYQDTWRSPVPGWTPQAPELEGGPSVALLAAQLGIAALGTIGKDWFKGGNPRITAEQAAGGSADFGRGGFKASTSPVGKLDFDNPAYGYGKNFIEFNPDVLTQTYNPRGLISNILGR